MLSEDKNAEAKEKDGAFAGKAANKNGKRKEKKNGGRGCLGRISRFFRLCAADIAAFVAVSNLLS